MKIFLTGASGFIGSHVARVLLDAGCDVTALVRPSTDLWRLKDVADRISFVTADLSETAAIGEHLDRLKPDACIHCAWYAEPGKYLNSNENIRSLTGSLGLLEELIRVGCRQIVLVGTCFEYRMHGGPLSETDPADPETIYAAAKLSFNMIAQHRAKPAGVRVAWARLFYQFGPYEDERRVVPAVIKTLLRGETFLASAGEQVRDYLHVQDVARALWALVDRQVEGIVNIASGNAVTMRRLMETIGALMDRAELIRFGSVPYRTWEPMEVYGNNRRLTQEAHWKPCYAHLSEGLQETIQWWTERYLIQR